MSIHILLTAVLLLTPIRIPLGLGTASPIVKVINCEGVFVDRKFDPLLSEKEIENELNITLWASHHGIAPKVHSANTSGIIMDWIEGDHFKELSFNQITDLAKCFRQLHSLPHPENIHHPIRSCSLDYSMSVYSQLEKIAPIPSYLKSIFSNLIEETNVSEKLTLCHGDVHANNLIWSKDKLYFIDWTCAGLDYPIVDLAKASMFWEFSAAQDRQLLRSYFDEEPDAVRIQQLEMFKKHVKINWAMWPIKKILVDFPDRAVELGEILENRFRNPSRRPFEEYRLALFEGTFNLLVREFDDWVDLHFARIQTCDKARAELTLFPIPETFD